MYLMSTLYIFKIFQKRALNSSNLLVLDLENSQLIKKYLPGRTVPKSTTSLRRQWYKIRRM
jgi:hypothetical protein